MAGLLDSGRQAFCFSISVFARRATSCRSLGWTHRPTSSSYRALRQSPVWRARPLAATLNLPFGWVHGRQPTLFLAYFFALFVLLSPVVDAACPELHPPIADSGLGASTGPFQCIFNHASTASISSRFGSAGGCREQKQHPGRHREEGKPMWMHAPLGETGEWLRSVVLGYFAITRCRAICVRRLVFTGWCRGCGCGRCDGEAKSGV